MTARLMPRLGKADVKYKIYVTGEDNFSRGAKNYKK
jgi:hypothetical protein